MYVMPFKFPVQGEVWILPWGMTGTVVGLYFFLTEGRKYLVRHKREDAIYEDFFFEWELRDAGKQESTERVDGRNNGGDGGCWI